MRNDRCWTYASGTERCAGGVETPGRFYGAGGGGSTDPLQGPMATWSPLHLIACRLMMSLPLCLPHPLNREPRAVWSSATGVDLKTGTEERKGTRAQWRPDTRF